MKMVHHINFKQIDYINTLIETEILNINICGSDLSKTLEFFFMARTEMRAYYYDEMYLCKNGFFTYDISQVKVITNEYRTLSFILPRLIGKMKCWQEINVYFEK